LLLLLLLLECVAIELKFCSMRLYVPQNDESVAKRIDDQLQSTLKDHQSLSKSNKETLCRAVLWDAIDMKQCDSMNRPLRIGM
jgi:hypothetical protein